MENIFENAYFGKAYKTKGEKKAIYIHHYKDSEGGDMHYLIIDGSVITYVWGANGKIAPSYNNDGLDIISEWEEQIDEEELDRVAENERLWYRYEHQDCSYTIDDNVFKDAFKVGARYMKSKGGKI